MYTADDTPVGCHRCSDSHVPASKRCCRQPSRSTRHCRTLYHTWCVDHYFRMEALWLVARREANFGLVECCLYFNHMLFRGNRVSKMSSYDLNAFASPNFPPLVNGWSLMNFRHTNARLTDSCMRVVGIDIVVNWHDVIRQTNLKRFRSHKCMFSIHSFSPHSDPST